jgi:hypothetical protein
MASQDLPTLEDRPTFGDLLRSLRALGFFVEPASGSLRVCRHANSDTRLELEERPEAAPARLADLAAVRRRLLERGLIDVSDFAQFMDPAEQG